MTKTETRKRGTNGMNKKIQMETTGIGKEVGEAWEVAR